MLITIIVSPCCLKQIHLGVRTVHTCFCDLYAMVVHGMTCEFYRDFYCPTLLSIVENKGLSWKSSSDRDSDNDVRLTGFQHAIIGIRSPSLVCVLHHWYTFAIIGIRCPSLEYVRHHWYTFAIIGMRSPSLVNVPHHWNTFAIIGVHSKLLQFFQQSWTVFRDGI